MSEPRILASLWLLLLVPMLADAQGLAGGRASKACNLTELVNASREWIKFADAPSSTMNTANPIMTPCDREVVAGRPSAACARQRVTELESHARLLELKESAEARWRRAVEACQ